MRARVCAWAKCFRVLVRRCLQWQYFVSLRVLLFRNTRVQERSEVIAETANLFMPRLALVIGFTLLVRGPRNVGVPCHVSIHCWGPSVSVCVPKSFVVHFGICACGMLVLECNHLTSLFTLVCVVHCHGWVTRVLFFFFFFASVLLRACVRACVVLAMTRALGC